MKNIKLIVFILFLGMYFLGITAGSLQQVRTEKQDEMYSYLDGAVSGYDVKAGDSIKSVAIDNIKLLVIVLVCGLFKVGIIGHGAVILAKGFSTGFAITAMMRLYGIKGMIFCGANLISIVLLVPALALFGGISAHNLMYNHQDKQRFLKKYFIMAAIIALVFCIDSLTRGFFSSIFMRLAAGFLKQA